ENNPSIGDLFQKLLGSANEKEFDVKNGIQKFENGQENQDRWLASQKSLIFGNIHNRYQIVIRDRLL
ncbi:MAG: hypothetical protein KDI66_23240, partial [Xanthomonadales bacterium]|nr:hypothetical protein [Xanthomonadales bacterium]